MYERKDRQTSYPILYGAVVAILLLALSLGIAYQRHQIIKETEKEKLQQELHYTATRFKEILIQKISALNQLSIAYHDGDWSEHFDNTARQLIQEDSTIDFIAFLEKSTVKYVYPMEGNEQIIGFDMLSSPLLKKEIDIAMKNPHILFSGPYELAFGRGLGITARIFIVKDGKFKGVLSITTKLPTLSKAIPSLANNNDKFVFQLSKQNPATNAWEHFLQGFDPKKNTEISVLIPEGKWTLTAAMYSGYPTSKEAVYIACFGFLFAILGGLFAYKRAKLPEKLERIVKERTHDLGERIKELSTIYKLNELLKAEHLPEETIFKRIQELLPQGWQYPEDCEVRILFDGKEYTTSRFQEPAYLQMQSASFKLLDGREGKIDVIYTSQKPLRDEGCFIKEERDLLNSVVDTIAVHFNKSRQQGALKESEEVFRGAFEGSAIGMAIVSPKGKWLRVNKVLCEMLGYSKEELSEMTFYQITHPDDMGRDVKLLREMSDYEWSYYRTEKRYIHKNGSEIWVNLNVAIIRDSAGNPSLFISQIENITEKKMMMEQLAESEHKLRLFIEHSPASLAMFDMDMKYIITSKRWVADYRLEGKEVIGKSHYDVFPTLPQSWKDIHSRCLQGATEKCDEDSFIAENGAMEWLFWEIHPWRKASGEIGGIIMFTEVITDRVETRMKFQNLVEQSLVGVYIVQNGKFTYVNPKVVEESGYTEQELLSLPLEKFIYKDDIPVVMKNIQEKLQGKVNPNGYEIRAKKKDNSLVWIEMFGVVTFYQGAKAVIGTMINITDRKKMELEREMIMSDLIQHNKDLEQFADILSHNVRAPLSSILGLSTLIKGEKSEQEKALIIEGIEQSARQLDEVLKDLNAILRVRRDIDDLKMTVDLTEVIEDVKHMLLIPIYDTHATIDYDFSAVGSIYSMRSYIHNIFYRLISNAIKYARKDIAPHIVVTSWRGGGKVFLIFKDNGRGIDMQRYGAHLFKLYKRFHLDVEGKGMGLFMVKAQIEALGGSIEAESTEHVGSAFTISFDM